MRLNAIPETPSSSSNAGENSSRIPPGRDTSDDAPPCSRRNASLSLPGPQSSLVRPCDTLRSSFRFGHCPAGSARKSSCPDFSELTPGSDKHIVFGKNGADDCGGRLVRTAPPVGRQAESDSFGCFVENIQVRET